MRIRKSLMALLLLIILTNCNDNKFADKSIAENMLKTVFSMTNHHLQYSDEVNYLRKNRIKTMSFVTQIIGSSELDSITYLEYDIKGHLIKRTTTECTTVGCLPYITRQIFTHSNDTVKLFRNYTFKRKSSTVLANWLLNDLSQLSEFDYEEYFYKKDTIYVVSGPSSRQYIHDKNGMLKDKIISFKSGNQIDTMSYFMNNTSIEMKLKSRNYDHIPTTSYLLGDNSITIKYKRTGPELIAKIWNYNSKGLLTERINYRDGQKYSITKIAYGYFEKQ